MFGFSLCNWKFKSQLNQTLHWPPFTESIPNSPQTSHPWEHGMKPPLNFRLNLWPLLAVPSPSLPFFHLLSPPATVSPPSMSGGLLAVGSWCVSILHPPPPAPSPCPTCVHHQPTPWTMTLACCKPFSTHLPTGNSPILIAFRLCSPLLPVGILIAIKPFLSLEMFSLQCLKSH